MRQGCVAAPDLFNCVIDYLMNRVCNLIPSIQLNHYMLSDLEYADDTAIFYSSLKDLTDAIHAQHTESSKLGLKVSLAKTKLMHVGDGPDPRPVKVGSNSIDFVSSFIYLSSLLTNTGDLKPEIDRRRNLASSVMGALWKPLWCQPAISLNLLCTASYSLPYCKNLQRNNRAQNRIQQ